MQSKNAHFMQLAGAEPCGRISSALAAAHDNGVMLRSLPLLIHGVILIRIVPHQASRYL